MLPCFYVSYMKSACASWGVHIKINVLQIVSVCAISIFVRGSLPTYGTISNGKWYCNALFKSWHPWLNHVVGDIVVRSSLHSHCIIILNAFVNRPVGHRQISPYHHHWINHTIHYNINLFHCAINIIPPALEMWRKIWTHIYLWSSRHFLHRLSVTFVWYHDVFFLLSLYC